MKLKIKSWITKDKLLEFVYTIKSNKATLLGFIVVFGSLYLIYNVHNYTKKPVLIILWILFHLINIYVYYKYSSLLNKNNERKYLLRAENISKQLDRYGLNRYNSADSFIYQTVAEKATEILSRRLTDLAENATTLFNEDKTKINSICALTLFSEEILDNLKDYANRRITISGHINAKTLISNSIEIQALPPVLDETYSEENFSIEINSKKYHSCDFSINIYDVSIIEYCVKKVNNSNHHYVKISGLLSKEPYNNKLTLNHCKIEE